MRPQKPYRVDPAQSAPEPPPRLDRGSQDGQGLGQPPVIGQRNQLDPGPHRVAGPIRHRSLSPNQDQAVELPCQPGQEERKGALGKHLTSRLVIRVIGIHGQPHGGERR